MHYKAIHTGLLILRIGIGIMFMIHGVPKLLGGPETWAKLGGAMSNFGIDVAPTFWGLMAAIAEAIGGLCLITGFLFRPAALMMAATMLVAMFMHYSNGDPFVPKVSYPLEMMILFVSLFIAGPGNFTISEIFNRDGQD